MTDETALFRLCGRTDTYGEQQSDGTYRRMETPIIAELLKLHVKGETTVGAYLLNEKNCVKCLVLDFDKGGYEAVVKTLQNLGIPFMLEASGTPGHFHIWIMFAEPVAAGEAQDFGKGILNEAGIPLNACEIFPKQTELTKERPFGNLIKLPCALHRESKARAVAIENGKPFSIEGTLDRIASLKTTMPGLWEMNKVAPKKKMTLKVEPAKTPQPISPSLARRIREGRIKGERYENSWIVAKELYNLGYGHEYILNAVLTYNRNCQPAKADETIKKNVRSWLENVDKCLTKEISIAPPEIKTSEIETKVETINEPELEYITSHLPCFRELDEILRLRGDQYTLIKKALWYQIHSFQLRQNVIRLGNIETDCRIHLAVPLPSGSGKKNIITALESVAKPLGLTVAKPTSFHPEQLIGKTIRRGKKGTELEQIRGWFDANVLLFDEGIELLRSKEPTYSESRKYFAVALDPYGINEVCKKMVDVQTESALRYMPDCVCFMAFQPFSLSEEIVLMGLLRRFLVPFVYVKESFEVQNYDAKLMGSGASEVNQALLRLVAHLKTIKSEKVSFTKESIKRLSELHLELLKMGAGYSKKGRNYTLIVDYDLLDKLVKFSAIQALANGRKEVGVEDVEAGFVDLFELFCSTLRFVEKKVIGYLDYGEGWGGAMGREAQALSWLNDQGATDKDISKTTIEQFEAKLAELFEVKPEMARKRYYSLKKRGMVDSVQSGQYGSKVWLTVRGDKGGKGGLSGQVGVGNVPESIILQMNEYFAICGRLEGGQGGCHPYQPAHPEEPQRQIADYGGQKDG